MPRSNKKNNNNSKSSMKVKAPGARKNVESMKYEIANEFGVNLGANASSRENGLVGGEMTRRLIERGRNSQSSNNKSRNKSNSKSSNK